jgi:EAL domain-containing protein (putative c-di-GMP-specific phosphodiesterase class I)/GGDEF domain-containing protein
LNYEDVIDRFLLARTKPMLGMQLGLVLLLEAASCLLVYRTGGVTYVFSHSMYVPILLSGILFGIRGAVVFAVVGGMALGPFMPLDVVGGTMQPTLNWVLRCIAFASVGMLQGGVAEIVRRHLEMNRWEETHDTDTGLSNTNALFDSLSSTGGSVASDSFCCLAVFHVRNYNDILSTFGKDTADQCMYGLFLSTERQLRQIDGQGFQIFREMLCFWYAANSRECHDLLQPYRDLKSGPLWIDGIPFYLDMHMGTACQRFDCLEPESLLRQAMIAALAIDPGNFGSLHFDDRFEEETRRNLEIVGNVPKAIEEGEFYLVFQPIVRASDETVVAVETLLRWNSASLGELSPALFVPLIENTPLIDMLQNWILDNALGSLSLLNERFPRLQCSINISANTLHDDRFADRIASQLSRHGTESSNVVLEVTETAFMHAPDKAIETLLRLKELGVHIAIDDFGTGFSSLQYLERIPADFLKIDKSFVDRVVDERRTDLLLDWFLRFADDIGLTVVAEGVDSRRKASFLRSISCDCLQGFYFSKPLTYESLVSWIVKNKQRETGDFLSPFVIS